MYTHVPRGHAILLPSAPFPLTRARSVLRSVTRARKRGNAPTRTSLVRRAVIFFPASHFEKIALGERTEPSRRRNAPRAVRTCTDEGLERALIRACDYPFSPCRRFMEERAYVRKYLRSAFREMYGNVLYRGRREGESWGTT